MNAKVMNETEKRAIIRNQYFNQGENFRGGGSGGDGAMAKRIRKSSEVQSKQAEGATFEIPKNSYPFDCNRP